MNRLGVMLALPLLGLGLTPSATVSAQLAPAESTGAQATDGVLMAWTLGEETIELLREVNKLILVRTEDDAETSRERVQLMVDGGRAVYMPVEMTDGHFFVVTHEGELEIHQASGKTDATPQLVTVSDQQRALLDALAPPAPNEGEKPASWTDVINSLNGGGSDAAGGSAGSDMPVNVDPTRLDIEDLEDGTKRINERFILTGEGTKEKPYDVTWDYLTSAREAYRPREGKKDIAAHLQMLDGKYVRLGGYLQFPLASPEPKELLVMLNQWDGCCIGIPPTPYDAIEVSLSTPATGGEKFAAEGALVGKLKIDPYLVGDWLIGLYLLSDASLDVSGSRPAQEVYGNSPTVAHPYGLPGGAHSED